MLMSIGALASPVPAHCSTTSAGFALGLMFAVPVAEAPPLPLSERVATPLARVSESAKRSLPSGKTSSPLPVACGLRAHETSLPWSVAKYATGAALSVCVRPAESVNVPLQVPLAVAMSRTDWGVFVIGGSKRTWPENAQLPEKAMIAGEAAADGGSAPPAQVARRPAII